MALYCPSCSFPLEAEDEFCRRCGKALQKRKLRRDLEQKKVAGVCSGVARYFNKDPRLVRALWAGASILPFSPGLIAYGVAWAVMPRDKSKKKISKPAAAVSASSETSKK